MFVNNCYKMVMNFLYRSITEFHSSALIATTYHLQLDYVSNR